MSKEYRAGSLKSVQAGDPTLVEVNGVEIALFMAGDKVVATQGQCPHAEGPLHEGEVDANCILTCPWHGWMFDLRTGQCQEDDRLRLVTYPVRVDGDDILVSL